MIPNILISLGTLFALFAMAVSYLAGLWPADGIDPARLNLRLAAIQYGGLLIVLITASVIGSRIEATTRRYRILALVAALFFLGATALYRGHPEKKAESSVAHASPSKYSFSEDWVGDSWLGWSRVLGRLKGRSDVQALEIGSFEGRSALWFLENVLTGERSSITCVDIWAGPYEKTFDANMKAFGHPEKFVKIKSRSDQALRALKIRSYDFIYIDGSHEAKDVLMDAVLSWDLLKPGGIMIFDDYNWYGAQVLACSPSNAQGRN